MWSYPPSFGYRSVGPYLAICFHGDATVTAKVKRRLSKAILTMFRDNDDHTRWRAVIDGRGYLILSRGGQRGIMGTGETFDEMAEIAKGIGDYDVLDSLFTAELESRIMWPVDA